jgi:FixJ family two-component response regulator
MDNNENKLPSVEKVTLNANNLDYLTDTLEIREAKAKTYLLTRKGYTSSSIPRRVGVSSSTVEKYLEQFMEEYGKNSILTMNYLDGPILEPLPDIDEEQSSFD